MMKLAKVIGQKMIIKHIDNHSGIVSVFFGKSLFAFTHHLVTIGKSVYFAMEYNALCNFRFKIQVLISFDEIA